jgi:hypothetical protein
MADWPDTAELAQVLNVDNIDDWTTTLDRVMAAAISKVKADVGLWDELVDTPDDNLAQAALRLAELISLRPEVAAGLGSQSGAMAGIASDPVYQSLIYGHRRAFGIA